MEDFQHHNLRHCTSSCKLLTIFSCAVSLLLFGASMVQLLVERCIKNRNITNTAYFVHRILICSSLLLLGWVLIANDKSKDKDTVFNLIGSAMIDINSSLILYIFGILLLQFISNNLIISNITTNSMNNIININDNDIKIYHSKIAILCIINIINAISENILLYYQYDQKYIKILLYITNLFTNIYYIYICNIFYKLIKKKNI